MSSKEECALGMGQSLSTNDASVKDVLNLLRMEECALGTAQRSNASSAAAKDAQILLSKEERV